MCFASQDTQNGTVPEMHRPITSVGLQIFHILITAVDWNFIKLEGDAEAKANQFTTFIIGNACAAFPAEGVRRKQLNLQFTLVTWFNENLRHMRDAIALMQEVSTQNQQFEKEILKISGITID